VRCDPSRAEQNVAENTAALKERYVPQAVYDAQLNSGCMEQTRVRILNETETWIKDPESQQICWITGMAGTGKTSIAKTTCQRASVDPEITLGGSFFCSRSTGLAAQRDIRCVVPTLAQLLAFKSAEFRKALADTIESGIQYKEVSAQVEQLLRTPLRSLKDPCLPVLFVIDALDECGGETTDGMLDNATCHGIVTSMLEALVNLTRSDPKLPVKILATSRPEVQIRDTSISNDKLSQILRLHAVDIAEVDADINRYITQTLGTRLAAKPKLRASITDSDVKNLVRLCDGLFIVAATALAHIFGAGAAAAVANFKRLLSSSGNGLDDRAAAPLDRMYEIILNDAVRVDGMGLESLQRLLASLLSSRMTLSVVALADLLGLEPYDVSASLSRLHAVVHVPEEDDMPGLRTVHASFGDYLYSRAPGYIRIHQSLGHDNLANGCLELMGKLLHFNVSQSISSHDPNLPVQTDRIVLSLQYACMQWVYHVVASLDRSNIDVNIGIKFRPKLLAWLEIMSLLRQVWRAARMLFIAAGTVGMRADLILAQFLRDAHSFVASSHEAIERSAPHIYLSALPFADKSLLVYKDFAPRFTGLITVDTFGIGQHGGRAVMTLTGHDSAVHSVSYSPDGHLLASGSNDGTVRIWDTLTGEETMSPMRSGDEAVLSVDFARNGKWVASGTGAGNVCVWNVPQGKTSLKKLSNHSGSVRSVAFAPDSSRLASASTDKTIRLWNPEMGEQLTVLSGHTRAVTGVAFSPDGGTLASSSDDRSIRLWHSTTGQAACEPLGNAGYRSVDFSPDGEMISGAENFEAILTRRTTGERITNLKDGQVRWNRSARFSPDGQLLVVACERDVLLWTLHPDPCNAPRVGLGGHGGNVNWATFSPDGLYIASASDDGTIRIWSAGSGQSAVQPMHAHEQTVSSVVVSHDGASIISGSDDNSVRVWNAHTGEARLPPLNGHTGLVLSVSISPEGDLIASASADGTIQFWDAQSGAAAGEPMRDHTDWIWAVTFSHDGCWLASASSDSTVRMWDVATRQALAVGPLICQEAAKTVAFSPDDGIVAAGDNSGRIYLWRTDTGEQAHKPLHANNERVWSVAFSPDSTRIVSGGSGKAARIWDINTGRCLHVLQGHKNAVRSVAWSLDGRKIGTGSYDATIRLWDAVTGAPLATLRGHTKDVNSVAFTADTQFIISGSDDTTIRKWDVRVGCQPASERGNDPVTTLASASLKDGWLVGSSDELILWVPAEYRTYLQVTRNPCILVIGRSRVIIGVGDSGLHAGLNWTSCWQD